MLGLKITGVAEFNDAQAIFEEKANELLGESARRDAPTGSQGALDPSEKSAHDLASAVLSLAAVYLTTQDGAISSGDSDPDYLLQARLLLRSSFKGLSGQERKLLKLYYYRQLSLETVADALGVSVSRARYLHTRVADKLSHLMSVVLNEPES